jgi:uncharacterized membrane protein
MSSVSKIFNLLSVISLSLFSGAFLFIALVVVKFWQAVEPNIFLAWMNDNFFRFPLLMIPLNMVALLMTIAAFGTAWKSNSSNKLLLGLSLICIFICTSTYSIYFEGANAEFLNRSILVSRRSANELSQVSSALNTWSNWHWLRTILAIAALGFASWGLLQRSSNQNSETAS